MRSGLLLPSSTFFIRFRVLAEGLAIRAQETHWMHIWHVLAVHCLQGGNDRSNDSRKDDMSTVPPVVFGNMPI
jgi:hypothetical protein